MHLQCDQSYLNSVYIDAPEPVVAAGEELHVDFKALVLLLRKSAAVLCHRACHRYESLSCIPFAALCQKCTQECGCKCCCIIFASWARSYQREELGCSDLAIYWTKG